MQGVDQAESGHLAFTLVPVKGFNCEINLGDKSSADVLGNLSAQEVSDVLLSCDENHSRQLLIDDNVLDDVTSKVAVLMEDLLEDQISVNSSGGDLSIID